MDHDLMDQVMRVKGTKRVDNKRKWDENQRGDSTSKKKRQEVVRAYTVGPSEKKGYAGTASFCNKCKFHHFGPCIVQCKNSKRAGHQTRDSQVPTQFTPATTQRISVTCFECGVKGHFKSEYPKLKNQSGGNRNECERAHGREFVSGGGKAC
nr:reverse transcriptase domain-containing protein [Tanacetum cinerariifolium]